MTRLGRYFKAPPKRAVRQWLNVELLHAFGERFESGSSGVGRSCTTLALTVRHLADGGHAEAEVRRKLEAIRKLRAAR